MVLTDVQSRFLLRDVQIIRMGVCGLVPGSMHVTLTAKGSQESLEAMQCFTNASWLNDLNLPYLDNLLSLQSEGCGSVSLREEGWATLEDDADWVYVSDSYGDERSAIISWNEFKTTMQLKRRFLSLMRDCKGQGIPRYNITDGFRVRLHVPGCIPATTTHCSFGAHEA